MSLESRIDRLSRLQALRDPEFKSVEVVAELGPPIVWENPEYLTLRVPPAAWLDPLAVLTEEQSALIAPEDEVFVVPTNPDWK